MPFIYAISDIHGCYEVFQNTLEKIDLSSKDNQLILCGDYIDYGAESYQVLNKIQELSILYPNQVIALMGNHEHMFLDFLFCPKDDIWIYEWLKTDLDLLTIKTFVPPAILGEIERVKQKAKDEYSYLMEAGTLIRKCILTHHVELIDWLKQLSYFHETENQIFVHAGIDEEAGEYWQWGYDNKFFCTKYPHTKGKFSKDIIAGHIATSTIAGAKDYHQVYWDGQSHFYLDGITIESQIIPILKYDTITKKYSSLQKDYPNKWYEY